MPSKEPRLGENDEIPTSHSKDCNSRRDSLEDMRRKARSTGSMLGRNCVFLFLFLTMSLENVPEAQAPCFSHFQ